MTLLKEVRICQLKGVWGRVGTEDSRPFAFSFFLEDYEKYFTGVNKDNCCWNFYWTYSDGPNCSTLAACGFRLL